MLYFKFAVAILLTFFVATSSSLNETEALLNFKNSLSNAKELNSWNQSVNPPCLNDTANWIGLRCVGGSVNKLILEGMNLTGMVNVDALAELPNLRLLSLMNNRFDGHIPNVNRVGSLIMLYFSDNKFSGGIPEGVFSGFDNLKKVYLARNDFVGKIPRALAELPQLLEVDLEGNRFDGELPEFKGSGLTMVDVANNRLEGSIPTKLSEMSSTYFTGNNLCGKPLARCKSISGISGTRRGLHLM